jgi:hypothetical protein
MIIIHAESILRQEVTHMRKAKIFIHLARLVSTINSGVETHPAGKAKDLD